MQLTFARRGATSEAMSTKNASATAPVIAFVRLPHGADLPLPADENPGSAGMDLRAAIAEGERLVLKPGKRVLVPTGLILELPAGYEAQIRPRSGLALKNGVTCLNSPGTIDSDYRGEVQVLLINHGDEKFVIERGLRIAQMVIAPAPQAVIVEQALAGSTERGSGGFGSTGLQ